MDWLDWLKPWEVSPTLLTLFALGAWLFVRGRRVHHVTRARQILFWTGMVLLYLSLHTMLDYYAERMFFMHRIQHLVLHHLGPLVLMAAYPGSVMRAGLPLSWRVRLSRFNHSLPGRAVIAVLTNPILVPALFVFLVIIWLIPSVQFYSMLDWRLYRLMNWSVVLTGFMYWNLILDRRPSRSLGLPLLPGVATASDIMRAQDDGYTELKFFPAIQAGGIPMLIALGGPFEHIRFCPTGGMTQANANEYLHRPNVLCVGGSWLVPADALAQRDFARIESLARAAVQLKG